MIMRAKFGWWLQRIAIKMPLTVVILIFMSGKTSFFGLSEYEKSLFFFILYTYEHLKFHAMLSFA